MRSGLQWTTVTAALLAVSACDATPSRGGPAPWEPPPEDSIPNDSLGASIRRGLALLRFTPESLPKYASSNLHCVSCHQNDGRKATAVPLVGSHARFPRYLARTGAVVTLADRVNYCFTRSLAGNALPHESREMADILSYLAFLSRGAPVGGRFPGAEGLAAMKDTLVGDIARGEALFKTTCVVCHGVDGGGNPGFPALWGPRSFAIGASMAREERAASFIHQNMPQNAPGTLTPQQAFDVAAFVNSHPRPDSPGKDKDYPAGGAPKDTPYDTQGHAAHRAPPSLVPRQNPAGATVPAPPSIRRSGSEDPDR